MIITRINSLVPEIKSENIIECIAGEDIPAGVVIIKDADTLAYCADIYNESHAHRTIGISLHSAFIGEAIKVQVTSSMRLISWNWEFNKPVYCGDYGYPTQEILEKGFTQVVGIPYSSDMLYVDIEPAILSDSYKPAINIEQDKRYASKYQIVSFTCTNTGYETIEWKLHGLNAMLEESEITGMDLIGPNITNIKVKWADNGHYSVKARIKDPQTKLWSAWSAPAYADIL